MAQNSAAVAASDAASPTERVSGTVKFFNQTRGFGFVVLEGEQMDAFLHISVVQESGYEEMPRPGDEIECAILRNRIGIEVTEVFDLVEGEVDDSRVAHAQQGPTVTGEVKFYDSAKGFGFISTEEGDVFVHQDEVFVARVELAPGDLVKVSTKKTERGLRVVKFLPLG